MGGIGLGLGYIAPVSTLVKWFPDRPGLATGMAIMGFGGGAMIASPLSVLLMKHFHAQNQADVGVQGTFIVMGSAYFCFMMFGALIIRVPAPGWAPAGHDPAKQTQKVAATADVSTAAAMRAPQFYLLWLVLVCNTTAGIGILEQAAPMITEIFSSHFPQVPPDAKLASVAAAAGFVGLISLFNLLGRFFWASSSDYIGRKTTVAVFLGINAVCFWLIPVAGGAGSVLFFVAVCAVILSIYGGGFSTSPAYLKDLFGTKNFGPIYGRLLTAWSTAGVVGPLIVNYIRQQKLDAGIKGCWPLHRHHAPHGRVARGGLYRQPVRASRHAESRACRCLNCLRFKHQSSFYGYPTAFLPADRRGSLFDFGGRLLVSRRGSPRVGRLPNRAKIDSAFPCDERCGNGRAG